MRYNLIKRIGEYKMAVIGGRPATVRYIAAGASQTPELERMAREKRRALSRRGCRPGFSCGEAVARRAGRGGDRLYFIRSVGLLPHHGEAGQAG